MKLDLLHLPTLFPRSEPTNQPTVRATRYIEEFTLKVKHLDLGAIDRQGVVKVALDAALIVSFSQLVR